MSYFEVKARRYDVAVTRSFDAAHQSPNRRFVWLHDLEKVMGDGLAINPCSGVMIVFSDRAPEDFGTFDKANGIVNVKSHLSDFSDVYRLIQTESPIFFRWSERAASAGTIGNYRLHADYEAVGEGFEDTTP